MSNEFSQEAISCYQQAIARLVQSGPNQPEFKGLLQEATAAFGERQENDAPLYVSVYDPETLPHLQRHFQESSEIGSKFFPSVEATVLAEVERTLFEAYADTVRSGAKPGRAERTWQMEANIGTDAVVDLEHIPETSRVTVVRDAGQRTEAVITAMLASKIPETNEVTLIGGNYGPSGKWGIYTTHPGKIAPPMSDKDYWSKHGFLATQDQLVANKIDVEIVNGLVPVSFETRADGIAAGDDSWNRKDITRLSCRPDQLNI